MSDDTGILLFLAAGVLVLILIVVFGVLGSRRKKRATEPTFSARQSAIGRQPFLESSDLTLDDTRQEEIFRQRYAIGGTFTLPVTDAAGTSTNRQVEISRIGRSLRAGWPQAKLGLSVYFREWEQSEFPASFAVKGSDRIVAVSLDADGITALDAASAVVWSSPWERLLFSNGPDLVLGDGASRTVRLEYRDADAALEELIVKYGTLKQMHF
ncbi:hypothetical protein ACI3KS_18775 [Microbacterium sp. ZW T5_45]|uniref:hypothetical protein n=1 Tax=Microbacterium sp. ZW T5_45 TaxID=3378080 RepID=UPI0038543A14